MPLSLDPYSPLHSPQHRGYPDASSRPLPSTEGETQRDLPVTAVATGEAHCMRLRERIAQLENELDRKANIITTMADEISRQKQATISEPFNDRGVYRATVIHAHCRGIDLAKWPNPQALAPDEFRWMRDALRAYAKGP